MLGVWGRPAPDDRDPPRQPAEHRRDANGERFYLGSLRHALPGKVAEVPDRTGFDFTATKLVAFDVKGEPSVG